MLKNCETKAQIKQYAFLRGFEAQYSGHQQRWFLYRITVMPGIHILINSK